MVGAFTFHRHILFLFIFNIFLSFSLFILYIRLTIQWHWKSIMRIHLNSNEVSSIILSSSSFVCKTSYFYKKKNIPNFQIEQNPTDNVRIVTLISNNWMNGEHIRRWSNDWRGVFFKKNHNHVHDLAFKMRDEKKICTFSFHQIFIAYSEICFNFCFVFYFWCFFLKSFHSNYMCKNSFNTHE